MTTKTKTYRTTRQIRGEKRQVEITRKKDGKESIRILKKKKSKTTSKKLSFKEAKRIQKTRSKQARNRDSKTTSKKLVKDSRWKKNPGKFDFPGIDTKGKGKKTEKETKKEKAQDKKRIEKYDRELEDWQKKRQKKRDKQYEPKLKEAIKKLDKFQKGDVGLTKLFNREFSKVGTRANREKLVKAYDRNERRLRVKHEKRKLKELIRTEKDPERLRRLKESQKIAKKSAKRYIKGR